MIIRDLPTGEKMQFRVRAYNMAGPSPPATLSQAVTIREIMREFNIHWITIAYKENCKSGMNPLENVGITECSANLWQVLPESIF